TSSLESAGRRRINISDQAVIASIPRINVSLPGCDFLGKIWSLRAICVQAGLSRSEATDTIDTRSQEPTFKVDAAKSTWALTPPFSVRHFMGPRVLLNDQGRQISERRGRPNHFEHARSSLAEGQCGGDAVDFSHAARLQRSPRQFSFQNKSGIIVARSISF